MEQRELIKQVVDDLLAIPEVPTDGRYLSLAEAETIVDETIEHVRKCGEAAEYVYLTGHRRRLVLSLTMIPFAESEEASCLDVGCYGYMAFWAWRNLGYARVEGIEMRPDADAPVQSRTVELGGQRLDLKVHNFNITQSEWPLQSSFDTVLFFETLEHVDRDPSGVMLNVTRRMHRDSTLVISVPNAVSYKTLQEFMTGAPPWTYWFFDPDLSHEPRHSFEYTPIFFKMMLRSAGLAEVTFRTICAYVERESVDDIFEIGAALSIESSLFGETMIAQARKVCDEPLFRYPDCLYDGDRYYRTTYPEIHGRMERARETFLQSRRKAEEIAKQGRAEAEDSARRARAEAEDSARRARAEAERAIAARQHAERLAVDAAARSREALFLCENYLEKLRAREAALIAAEQRTAQLMAEREAAEQRAARALGQYEAINRSSFWRVTGPARRVCSRYPKATARLRTVLAPMARACRGLLRRLEAV